MNASFYNTNQTIDFLKSRGPDNTAIPKTSTVTYGKIGIGSLFPDTNNFVMDVFGPTRHVCETFQICSPNNIFTSSNNKISFPYNSSSNINNDSINYPLPPVYITPPPDIITSIINDVSEGINNLLKPNTFDNLFTGTFCDFSNNKTYITVYDDNNISIYYTNGIYPQASYIGNSSIILDPTQPSLPLNSLISYPILNDLTLPTIPIIFSVLGDSLINGNLFYSGQLVNSSDIRIKKEIKDYDTQLSLEKINNLRLVSYVEIDDKNRQKHIGFIAQELDKVLPESVKKNEKKYIPDIYQWVKCSWNDEKKYLEINNSELNFNFMEHIKIIDDMDTEFIITVIDTENDLAKLYCDSFIEKNPSIRSSYILLYGHEIKDFHRIDKNMIFSVCIGAVQELSKKEKESKLRINLLEEKVLKLEKLIETLMIEKKEEKILKPKPEPKPRKPRVKKENK